MNMSENVGRLGGGLQGVNLFYHTLEKICWKVMFFLTIFLMTKIGTRRHQSSDQSVLNFSFVVKVFFCHNLASFCCFLNNSYTVLSRSDYYSIIKEEPNENWARSLKLK